MDDKKIVDFEAKKAGINVSGKKENREARRRHEKEMKQQEKQEKKASAIAVGLEPAKPQMKMAAIKDGKVVEVDPGKVDQQTTVYVKNPEIDACIEAFTENKNDQTLTALINALERSRILLPGKMVENSPVPVPLTINTSEGEIMQPIFSDKEKMDKAPAAEVTLNLPFVAILESVVEKGPNIKGIVINPFSQAVILKRELLEKMLSVLKESLMAQRLAKAVPGGAEAKLVKNEDGTTSAQIKMTEQQLTMFERSRFERAFLPNQLFTNGAALIEGLTTKKEEFLDNMFEEAYANQRMYPYLTEEFKVMSLGISEKQEIIIITMPARNMDAGMAETIYIAWDKEASKGRYFILARGKKAGEREMHEVNEARRSVMLGAAPVEGTELNWIISKLNESEN